ncbi:hypothetical protein D3C72_1587330 [compost metagenome]
MLALRAAGVGLVAVPVAEARIDAQPYAMARRGLADAGQHVQRPGIDGDAVFEHRGERGVVDQIRGEDNAFGFAARLEACGQAAFDLAQRHGIDDHAFRAHEAQDVQVGARLLGVADRVEAAQLRDAVADDGGVVHPQRRAVLGGELGELARIEGHGVLNLVGMKQSRDDARARPSSKMLRCPGSIHF